MSKKVRVLDFIFFPLWAICFLLGYIFMTLKAGVTFAEYYYDPDGFMKRYTK